MTKPEDPRRVRLVKPDAGVESEALSPRPMPSLKIKGIAPAPAGWLAWFIDQGGDASSPCARTPLVGFATVEADPCDYVAPMVALASEGYVPIDARRHWAFLLLSGPGEDLADSARRASECAAMWSRWWTRRGSGRLRAPRDTPRDCRCNVDARQRARR